MNNDTTINVTKIHSDKEIFEAIIACYPGLSPNGFEPTSMRDDNSFSLNEFQAASDKDATINACALAPKRVYTTRAAAIAAAEKDGWIVTSDTHAASLGRKGGQAKTPAKSAAAKRRENSGLAKGREKLAALTPEQRSENARKAAAARWAKKKEE